MAYQVNHQQQGTYEYDAVSGYGIPSWEMARSRILASTSSGQAVEAFTAEEQAVLLIDEVDKANAEFPNDLLVELDRMEFFVYETRDD